MYGTKDEAGGNWSKRLVTAQVGAQVLVSTRVGAEWWWWRGGKGDVRWSKVCGWGMRVCGFVCGQGVGWVGVDVGWGGGW